MGAWFGRIASMRSSRQKWLRRLVFAVFSGQLEWRGSAEVTVVLKGRIRARALHWAERRHARGGEGRSTGQLERGALKMKATLATRRIPNLQAEQTNGAGSHEVRRSSARLGSPR